MPWIWSIPNIHKYSLNRTFNAFRNIFCGMGIFTSVAFTFWFCKDNQSLAYIFQYKNMICIFFPFQSFSAIQNEPCWGCSLIELQKAPFPKIFHTYRTIMKLFTVVPYLKKIQNYMDGVTYSMNSAEISIFEPKKTNFFYMKILIQMYIAL